MNKNALVNHSSIKKYVAIGFIFLSLFLYGFTDTNFYIASIPNVIGIVLLLSLSSSKLKE